MAMTPYPDGNDAFENPSLRGSNDGFNWQIPSFLPDPIILQSDSSDQHYSDPHILLKDGELHLFYRMTDKIKKRSFIFWTRSKDLVKWVSPILVYEGDWCLSPSIIFEDNVWCMWFIDLVKDNKSTISALKMVKGATPEAFDNEVSCVVDLGKFHPWHIEVKKVDGNFQGLINAFPGTSESIGQSLFLVKSLNGYDWNRSDAVSILKPSYLGWDNKLIYKASFLSTEEGRYRIWYSACSWGGKWYIGYIEGALNRIKRISIQPALELNRVLKVKQDLNGIFRIGLRRFLPEYVFNLTKKLYNFLVS